MGLKSYLNRDRKRPEDVIALTVMVAEAFITVPFAVMLWGLVSVWVDLPAWSLYPWTAIVVVAAYELTWRQLVR